MKDRSGWIRKPERRYLSSCHWLLSKEGQLLEAQSEQVRGQVEMDAIPAAWAPPLKPLMSFSQVQSGQGQEDFPTSSREMQHALGRHFGDGSLKLF